VQVRSLRSYIHFCAHNFSRHISLFQPWGVGDHVLIFFLLKTFTIILCLRSRTMLMIHGSSKHLTGGTRKWFF
jgi:hypothetical protein